MMSARNFTFLFFLLSVCFVQAMDERAFEKRPDAPQPVKQSDHDTQAPSLVSGLQKILARLRQNKIIKAQSLGKDSQNES